MPPHTFRPHPHKPVNTNLAHAREMAVAGFNRRLAVSITKGFGTIGAFYALVIWMLLWIVLATLGFWLFARDPYPFPFLLFCSNLVQLWALPVLAVGQQVLSRKQELQADEMFSTTEKSFHDIEEVMRHLLAQDEELAKQTTLLIQLLEKKTL